MSIGRYELSDVQWSRIEGLLPGRTGTVGRTALHNCVFMSGVLWVLCSALALSSQALRQVIGACTSDSATGRQVGSGRRPSVTWWLIGQNAYLILDSTIVRTSADGNGL